MCIRDSRLPDPGRHVPQGLCSRRRPEPRPHRRLRQAIRTRSRPLLQLGHRNPVLQPRGDPRGREGNGQDGEDCRETSPAGRPPGPLCRFLKGQARARMAGQVPGHRLDRCHGLGVAQVSPRRVRRALKELLQGGLGDPELLGGRGLGPVQRLEDTKRHFPLDLGQKRLL